MSSIEKDTLKEKYKDLLSSFNSFRSSLSIKDMHAELKFDPEDIGRELERQPSLYFYYAGLYSNAEEYEARFKNLAKTAEGVIEQGIRKEAREKRIKETDSSVKSRLASDEFYNEVLSSLVDAQKLLSLLKVLKESFYMRRDMLVQVSANKRELASNYISS